VGLKLASCRRDRAEILVVPKLPIGSHKRTRLGPHIANYKSIWNSAAIPNTISGL
jgi:hypothetical protein